MSNKQKMFTTVIYFWIITLPFAGGYALSGNAPTAVNVYAIASTAVLFLTLFAAIPIALIWGDEPLSSNRITRLDKQAPPPGPFNSPFIKDEKDE